MAVRYRSAYRRYLLVRRLRTVFTCLGGLFGLIVCYMMYQNLQQNGLALGREEMIALAGVLALSAAAPWLILTALVKKPSDL